MCKKKYKKYNLPELGDELVEWMKEEENVWLKGFAIFKEFPTSYFSRYKKQNKYFAEKLAIAKDIQESKLVQGVLGRKYSPSFVKFILKNEAGWKDKIEETIKEEVPAIQFVLAEKKVPEESGKDNKQKKNKNQFKLFNEDK